MRLGWVMKLALEAGRDHWAAEGGPRCFSGHLCAEVLGNGEERCKHSTVLVNLDAGAPYGTERKV